MNFTSLVIKAIQDQDQVQFFFVTCNIISGNVVNEHLTRKPTLNVVLQANLKQSDYELENSIR